MEHLLSQLPKVRGSYKSNYNIAKQMWFRCGGIAKILFKPQDEQDLAFFFRNKPSDVDTYIIGAGSNLIIRDGGFDGVIIKMGRGFNNVFFEDDFVDVGSAFLDKSLSLLALEQGFSGVEFLSGIPGAIGGALRMNAGCYGGEIKDIFVACRAMDNYGNIHVLRPQDMGFGYRKCKIPQDWIFLNARLRLERKDKNLIAQKMQYIKEQRESSQPLKGRTGGSTFANPDVDAGGKKAWELIDSVGGRGMKYGGAQVCNKHCNFLLNTGQATASDLESLGNKICELVKQRHGIELHWEIKIIGESNQVIMKANVA